MRILPISKQMFVGHISISIDETIGPDNVTVFGNFRLDFSLKLFILDLAEDKICFHIGRRTPR
jgi:hypothetical protein